MAAGNENSRKTNMFFLERNFIIDVIFGRQRPFFLETNFSNLF
jgi:hypothetical protein